MVGVSAQTIRNWEIGRHEPQLDSIDKLANCYQVTADALLHEDGTRPAEPRNSAVRYNRILIDPERLEQARLDANMTRAEVEQVTGIGRHAIGRYERGDANPRPGALQILATVYQQPLESFGRGGFFTREERAVLGLPVEEEHRQRPSDDEPFHIVMGALDYAKPDLTVNDAEHIAEFIRFIHQGAKTRRENLERSRRNRPATRGSVTQEPQP